MGKFSAIILLGAVSALVAIGFVILTSVSAFASANNGNAYYFVIRQAIFLGAGAGVCWLAAKWDYHQWSRFSPALLVLGLALMAACFLPHFGVRVNGANRWINLGFIRAQPVELAKFGLMASLAWWLGTRAGQLKNFRVGVLAPLGMLVALAVLCQWQDDIGSAALMLIVALGLMFVAGTRQRYLVVILALGVGAIGLMAYVKPQKWARLTAFTNVEQLTDGINLQPHNALIAFGSGGISGRGLGQGVQKMKYLPEAHTDFIFPNIGEELGVIATLLVVLAFLLLVLAGWEIACHAPDQTGLLLGLGATSLIGLQGLMNMAVVTALMPTKGIGLPFISYGGSNLLLCFLLVGILLNIHFQAIYEPRKRRPASLPAAMTARM
ncbi:MAG: putative lipid II flippase FtsW [Verrucomicrobiales bacterium]|jgi:cell division protein FtsW|nr:putative lipid II flippase FtsW [Verrucomicrobiales bacterium]